jgi:hypothetical protein
VGVHPYRFEILPTRLGFYYVARNKIAAKQVFVYFSRMEKSGNKISAVQAAKTAIIQLANSVASIHAIIQTQDFEPEISVQAKEAVDTVLKVSYDTKSVSGFSLRDVEVMSRSVIRLADLVNRKKMQNPLLSSDLMNRIGIMEKEAREAIFLAETALK